MNQATGLVWMWTWHDMWKTIPYQLHFFGWIVLAACEFFLRAMVWVPILVAHPSKIPQTSPKTLASPQISWWRDRGVEKVSLKVEWVRWVFQKLLQFKHRRHHSSSCFYLTLVSTHNNYIIHTSLAPNTLLFCCLGNSESENPQLSAVPKDIDPPDVNRLCTTTWVLKGYLGPRRDRWHRWKRMDLAWSF